MVERESSSNPDTPADNSLVGQPITEDFTEEEAVQRTSDLIDAIESAQVIHEPAVPKVPNEAEKAHEEQMSQVAHESWLAERNAGFKQAEEFLQRHAAIAMTNGHRTVSNDLRNVLEMLRSVKNRVLSTHYWKLGSAAKEV